MYLEAVTICINYSHELKHSITNKDFFDRWVIVTVADDKDTIALCEDNGVDYVFSERIHEDNAPFAKGKALNEGFDALSQQDWLVTIDSDILLPADFRETVERIPNTPINQESLFGLKFRRLVATTPVSNYPPCTTKTSNLKKLYDLFYADFKEYIESNTVLSHEQASDFQNKAHVAGLFESIAPTRETQWHYLLNGQWENLPISFEGHQHQQLGYCQLFHHSSFRGYSEASPDANWDDIIFRNQYPPERRQTLDLECVHIGINTYTEKREADKDCELFAKPMDIDTSTIKGDDWFDYDNPASYVQLNTPREQTNRTNEQSKQTQQSNNALQINGYR